MGRGVVRALVWAAASLSMILAVACGGDDDEGLAPFETTDAAGDTSPGDAAAKRDAVAEATAPDTSSTVRDASADAVDSGADRATPSDARETGPVADANRDAADASRPPDALPDSTRPDVGPDVGPDTALDARTPDALPDLTPVPDVADVVQPPDAGPDAVEASPDGSDSDAAPDTAVSPDAPPDAGDETAAGDAQGDGGGLAERSWQVGSDSICSTLESADCMDDLATNTFAVAERAMATLICPMAPSDARLWFMQTGAPPVDGDYAVMAAASDVDVGNVGPGQVAVEIVGTLPAAAAWWAQSGSVHVETQGTDLSFTFQNLAASDGTNPTTLSGHLICTPL